MLSVQTLFDFRITVGILTQNLGAQLERVLNHRLPLDFYSRSPRNFTVLFTILEKKGENLYREFSYVRITPCQNCDNDYFGKEEL